MDFAVVVVTPDADSVQLLLCTVCNCLTLPVRETIPSSAKLSVLPEDLLVDLT